MKLKHNVTLGSTWAFGRDSHEWEGREVAVVKLIRSDKLRISLSCDLVEKFILNTRKRVKSIRCTPDELY